MKMVLEYRDNDGRWRRSSWHEYVKKSWLDKAEADEAIDYQRRHTRLRYRTRPYRERRSKS